MASSAPAPGAASSNAAAAAERPKSSAFKSREEFKRDKELEEARKAGTVAPEQDEHGNDINPHIPEYISKAPWYVPHTTPTLKHQRNLLAAERAGKFGKYGDWYGRGERAGPAATKFRKGACENCGAMTHKRKNCLERPRAKGAKWTGKDIAADEVVRDVNLDYEGKRDRWNGYDAKTYRQVEERHRKVEAERRRIHAEKMEKALRDGKRSGAGGSDDDDLDDDGRPDTDASEVVMQQKDQATPAVVRNLRIREDTAKYLHNLDLNSAYYDPKTRSMRADPNPHVGANEKDFAGDNFVRYTGDVRDLARMELHSLKAAEDGRDLPHLLAEPTTAEEVHKDFSSRKKAIEEQRRTEILERYGGEEHVMGNSKISGVQESEAYVEYNRDGQVLSGKEALRPSSKYAEDLLENKHTAVWGSYYAEGKWGYDCCHQMVRNAYCTGESGKLAAKELADEMTEKVEAALRKRTEASTKLVGGSKTSPNGNNREAGKRAADSLDAEQSKRRKIEAAMGSQQAQEEAFEPDDRRRKYNSSGGHRESTEEDLEAYRRRKQSSDDPMAKYGAEK